MKAEQLQWFEVTILDLKRPRCRQAQRAKIQATNRQDAVRRMQRRLVPNDRYRVSRRLSRVRRVVGPEMGLPVR